MKVGKAYRERPCCQTIYNCHHLDNCPERGMAARAVLPCDIAVDGWCASHSTGSGPNYCEGATDTLNRPGATGGATP